MTEVRKAVEVLAAVMLAATVEVEAVEATKNRQLYGCVKGDINTGDGNIQPTLWRQPWSGPAYQQYMNVLQATADIDLAHWVTHTCTAPSRWVGGCGGVGRGRWLTIRFHQLHTIQGEEPSMALH